MFLFLQQIMPRRKPAALQPVHEGTGPDQHDGSGLDNLLRDLSRLKLNESRQLRQYEDDETSSTCDAFARLFDAHAGKKVPLREINTSLEELHEHLGISMTKIRKVMCCHTPERRGQAAVRGALAGLAALLQSGLMPAAANWSPCPLLPPDHTEHPCR